MMMYFLYQFPIINFILLITVEPTQLDLNSLEIPGPISPHTLISLQV